MIGARAWRLPATGSLPSQRTLLQPGPNAPRLIGDQEPSQLYSVMIMVKTVSEEAADLRRTAEAGPVGKRQTSFELYELLAGCMALAERCESGGENAEMRALVAQQPTTGNRRYVERGSDAFSLVCRYVFHDIKSPRAERSNGCRYAHCLRQAKKAGLNSATLVTHLRENGGINALFLVRPLTADSVTTRNIYLTSAVTLPKAGSATLRIRRCADNRFDVLAVEVAP